jgi:hypothetical protein
MINLSLNKFLSEINLYSKGTKYLNIFTLKNKETKKKK